MLNIFSCACWPSLCLLLRFISSAWFLIKLLSVFFSSTVFTLDLLDWLSPVFVVLFFYFLKTCLFVFGFEPDLWILSSVWWCFNFGTIVLEFLNLLSSACSFSIHPIFVLWMYYSHKFFKHSDCIFKFLFVL